MEDFSTTKLTSEDSHIIKVRNDVCTSHHKTNAAVLVFNTAEAMCTVCIKLLKAVIFQKHMKQTIRVVTVFQINFKLQTSQNIIL